LTRKNSGLNRLGAEAQILIEAPGLLVVEVDVKELAAFERLRDRVEEAQAGHLLVRELGVDAHHLRVRQRVDEAQIGAGRGK
jgi:hypothetical protein